MWLAMFVLILIPVLDLLLLTGSFSALTLREKLFPILSPFIFVFALRQYRKASRETNEGIDIRDERYRD